jgi:uncharacterized coiled-coil protein SlyX
MTTPDREGLIARIRQMRRPAAARERSDTDAGYPGPDRLRALEGRVAHLEELLEGLQDSVHRESDRHARLISELQTQVQPSAMGAALAEDVRNRGL